VNYKRLYINERTYVKCDLISRSFLNRPKVSTNHVLVFKLPICLHGPLVRCATPDQSDTFCCYEMSE